MKKRLVFIVCASVVLVSGAVAQLSGTKTIDAAGSGPDNFTSFKQAIDTLNTYGVGTGGVTFQVASGTYSEPSLVINPLVNLPAADKPIVFTVAAGGTVLLNDTTSTKQWALTIGSAANPVGYVVLNGSNNQGSTRGWTIHNAGPDSSCGIQVFGDSVQILNLVVTLDYPWSKAPAQGIVLQSSPMSGNLVVYNCDVTANYGIILSVGLSSPLGQNVISSNSVSSWHRGIYATAKTNMTVVQANEVHGKTDVYPAETVYGIAVTSTDSTKPYSILQNTVHNLGSNAGVSATARQVNGIYTNGPGQYQITGNKVYDLFNNHGAATGELDSHGIYMSGSATIQSTYRVYNNLVYGLQDNDAGSTVNKWSAGIRLGPGQVFVFHNTVFIPGTTRNHFTAPILLEGGTVGDTVHITNNILYCRQQYQAGAYSKIWSIYRGNTQVSNLVSDYNLLYVYGTSQTFVGKNGTGGDKATLALWQAAGFDKHSVLSTVSFADTTADFHLAGTSIGDVALAGTGISAVTTDIEGNTRNVRHPYTGAYEAATPIVGIRFSPSALSFGNLVLADSLVDTVLVYAQYNKEFVVNSVSQPGSGFRWPTTAPDTVKDTTEYVVTFKPQSFGQHLDSLRIMSDFGTATIGVTGASPAPILLTSQSALAFGSVRTDSSAVLSVLVRDSSINRLMIDSIFTRTSAFVVDRQDGSALTDTLEIFVAYMPSDGASHRDTLYLRNNSANALVKIPLSGSGILSDQVMLAEDFTGSTGTALTSAGWTQSGSTATNPLTISTTGGLSFGHYSGSAVGNAVTLAASGQDVYRSFPTIGLGSVYFSFMLNVSGAGTGDYFIALSPSSSQTNYYARLHIKASGSGYVFGISKSNEVSGGASYGTTVFNFGVTNLLVVQYTFVPPAVQTDTANDLISVYCFTGNTAPGTLPPTPEVGPYTCTTKYDANDLGFVTIRQGSSGAAPSLVLDGIRIANTWTLATPTPVEKVTEVPHVFSLKQNYPNPFNPSTNVEFTVATGGWASVRVYNMLGQAVATLFDGRAEAGQLYRRTFNGTGLSSGMYFVRFQSGTRVAMKKMLLVK